jgi:DNA-binding NtrC family response regulator
LRSNPPFKLIIVRVQLDPRPNRARSPLVIQMREDVCIVLNEREPAKARAAVALKERLSAISITSSQLTTDQRIADIVLERLPRIIVTDYLLGDFSTGLDLLHALQEVQSERRPRVIFLTDEPSAQVAVEALKLGALDFLELDNPQALPKLVALIEANLTKKPKRDARERVALSLADLSFYSPKSKDLLLAARTQIQKKLPLLLIHGSSGVGSYTLARALTKEVLHTAVLIDLATALNSDQALKNWEMLREQAITLIVRHADHDQGSCAEYILRCLGDRHISHALQVIVCATSSVGTKLWRTLAKDHLSSALQPEVLILPGLEERPADITPLVQRFITEARELSGEKVKPFTTETLEWMTTLSWPGQVTQLRSVSIDAAVQSLIEDSPANDLITRAKDRWEESQELFATPSEIELHQAATIFELSGRNYQHAAARLGMTPLALRTLLRSTVV